MKKIFAIAVLIASAQVSAFWGWNDGSGYGSTYDNVHTDAVGAGEAGADFTFDINFTARMRSEASASGSGYGNAAGDAYRHSAYIPFYGAPYGFAPPAASIPSAE